MIEAMGLLMAFFIFLFDYTIRFAKLHRNKDDIKRTSLSCLLLDITLYFSKSYYENQQAPLRRYLAR
jgi:hypothetical protein